jgi:hypothetical protein
MGSAVSDFWICRTFRRNTVRCSHVTCSWKNRAVSSQRKRRRWHGYLAQGPPVSAFAMANTWVRAGFHDGWQFCILNATNRYVIGAEVGRWRRHVDVGNTAAFGRAMRCVHNDRIQHWPKGGFCKYRFTCMYWGIYSSGHNWNLVRFPIVKSSSLKVRVETSVEWVIMFRI